MLLKKNKNPFTLILLTGSLFLASCGGGDRPYIVDLSEDEGGYQKPQATSHSHSAALVSPDESCEKATTQNEILKYGDLIKNLDGEILDTNNYETNAHGLNKFLKDAGIENFPSYEFTVPGSPSKARSCGLQELLPPKTCWYRTLSLLLTAEKIRKDINTGFKISSLYRPTCYNKMIKGAKNSDHLRASAMDLTFNKNPKTRKKIQNYVCDKMWKRDILGIANELPMENGDSNISFGLGSSLLHIGLNSPNGRRYWIYPSFLKQNSMPTQCWTKKFGTN